jgi:hypothetical protein
MSVAEQHPTEDVQSQPRLVLYTDNTDATDQAMRLLNELGLAFEIRLHRGLARDNGLSARSPSLWLPESDVAYHGINAISHYLSTEFEVRI